MAYQAQQNFVEIVEAALGQANALINKQGSLSKRGVGQKFTQINIINYFDFDQSQAKKDKKYFKRIFKKAVNILSWVGILTSPYLPAIVELLKKVLNEVS